ncbi:MAG: hypothetical protein KBG00_14745 [Rhodoferax sp.]|uniref:hypothetical protein n=1 Tax=Rhodoferax sp. TaxID=50421 RepID=UPI001B51AD3B|nr:hypothetical protein [Rhodoferax sp.]MBP9150031.1 hypothetical protein [Rhodoferax sp.]MBP9735566.1 hypothetical protein [Rhodoferax sp.]
MTPWPDVVGIIFSGRTDSQGIIASINEAGVDQFASKPWMPDHRLLALANAVEARTLQLQIQHLIWRCACAQSPAGWRSSCMVAACL